MRSLLLLCCETGEREPKGEGGSMELDHEKGKGKKQGIPFTLTLYSSLLPYFYSAYLITSYPVLLAIVT